LLFVFSENNFAVFCRKHASPFDNPAEQARGGLETMQYLLLIYNAESNWASMTEADTAKMRQEFRVFTQSIIDSGNYKGGNELHPTSKATTVRVQDGKTLVTDGPFAETKEQLGGYYLIEAADLDEATAIAARIPSANMGPIEVRPIVPMG
jgi:hypothetical protein